ncbi:MAG: AEC family transporter, partial [Paraclostridium sp.]
MNFQNVLIQILVLFILILVGYLCRYKNIIDDATTSGLTNLIMTILLPSMIVTSMQIDFTSNLIRDIISLILISIVMYSITILISLMLKKFLSKDTDLGIYQYVVIFSNVGFMGYPVIEAIFGNEAVFFTAIFNLPFNLLVFTIGTYLLNKDNSDYSFSFKALLSPPIISVLIGLALFILRIKLPSPIFKSIDMLGNITTPLSMIVIGSLLSQSPIKESFLNKKLYLIAFIRLIALPILVFLLLNPYIDNPLLLGIPVIISAMPAASNTAIMAKSYDANYNLASQAVFLTTLCSIITIPLISIF